MSRNPGGNRQGSALPCYLLPWTFLFEGIPEFICGVEIQKMKKISGPEGYRDCPPGRYSDSPLEIGLSGPLGTGVNTDAFRRETSGQTFQNKPLTPFSQVPASFDCAVFSCWDGV